eukprot:363740-Chlamydomonas_euryale.AAC.6
MPSNQGKRLTRQSRHVQPPHSFILASGHVPNNGAENIWETVRRQLPPQPYTGRLLPNPMEAVIVM